MPNLVSHNHCTACGACLIACPTKAITMQQNKIGALYPNINTKSCIKCNLCEKICPILNPCAYNIPITCYASWNLNIEERNSSASGGIAIAMYEYALKNNYICIGASQEQDFSVIHRIARTENDLKAFKNSKYVFSNAYNVFSELKQILKNNLNTPIVVIGLPCQIAAFKKLYSKANNLILVDLVCHGITPTSYLQQHIGYLEKKYKQKAKRMSFRAPEKGTSTYHFTLYNNNNEIFYSKRSIDGDKYNIAFHRTISYRENCYNCKFAQSKRVGDITLGDYHGLGSIKPSNYNQNKVSVVLINTLKGNFFFNNLINNGYIYAEERPLEEPINGDLQLQRPSPKNLQRLDFENLIYKYNGNFVRAINIVLMKNMLRNYMNQVKHVLRKFKHIK